MFHCPLTPEGGIKNKIINADAPTGGQGAKGIFQIRMNKSTFTKRFSIIILIFLSFCISIIFRTPASANPLLNVNSEDGVVYDNLLASPGSMGLTTTIYPFSYYKVAPFVDNYERIRLSLNAPDNPGYYIKPLSSITARYYYSGEKNGFMEGQSGMRLANGSNLLLFEDAFISLGTNVVLYCQLKQTLNAEVRDPEILRTYMKLLLFNISIEAGIDNVNIGPGEYGLLLSNNPSPYPMLKLQTEDSLNLFGKWDFILLNGWLREERDDYSDPSIMAARVVWKPFEALELGATRTVLYGGDGREDYDYKEYHKVFTGKRENVKGDRFENDSYAGYDLLLNIPLDKAVRWIKATRLYYQEAGTDVIAPWQEGIDAKMISLNERAFQTGLFLSTKRSIMRLEYASISKTFYSHRLYNIEGYSYKGLCLGYPYGGNLQSLLVKYRYYFTDRFSAEWRIGGYQQPAFNELDKPPRHYFDPLKPSAGVDNTMKRYFASVLTDLRIKNFIIEAYLRFDIIEGYDENPLPTQYTVTEKNKKIYRIGLSISWRI